MQFGVISLLKYQEKSILNGMTFQVKLSGNSILFFLYFFRIIYLKNKLKSLKESS